MTVIIPRDKSHAKHLVFAVCTYIGVVAVVVVVARIPVYQNLQSASRQHLIRPRGLKYLNRLHSRDRTYLALTLQ